jgi:hypothetical protein
MTTLSIAGCLQVLSSCSYTCRRHLEGSGWRCRCWCFRTSRAGRSRHRRSSPPSRSRHPPGGRPSASPAPRPPSPPASAGCTRASPPAGMQVVSLRTTSSSPGHLARVVRLRAVWCYCWWHDMPHCVYGRASPTSCLCVPMQEGLWAARAGGACGHAADPRLSAAQALLAGRRQRFRAGPRHPRQRCQAGR